MRRLSKTAFLCCGAEHVGLDRCQVCGGDLVDVFSAASNFAQVNKIKIGEAMRIMARKYPAAYRVFCHAGRPTVRRWSLDNADAAIKTGVPLRGVLRAMAPAVAYLRGNLSPRHRAERALGRRGR